MAMPDAARSPGVMPLRRMPHRPPRASKRVRGFSAPPPSGPEQSPSEVDQHRPHWWASAKTIAPEGWHEDARRAQFEIPALLRTADKAAGAPRYRMSCQPVREFRRVRSPCVYVSVGLERLPNATIVQRCTLSTSRKACPIYSQLRAMRFACGECGKSETAWRA